MASPSTSSDRSRRHRRRNRRTQNVSPVVNVDEYNAETASATCIDLTADVSGYDVIDLTSGQNVTIMDSPVVILSSTDDFGPVRRRRGSGRRGRHRSNSRRRLRFSVDSQSRNTPHSHVHIFSSEDSDSDNVLELSSETNQSRATASNSMLQSPEGVKISCPVCLDDAKQIHRNGRQVMSTTCGHIFCDACIKAAISAQHACPTCRRKLYLRNIHQLYL